MCLFVLASYLDLVLILFYFQSGKQTLSSIQLPKRIPMSQPLPLEVFRILKVLDPIRTKGQERQDKVITKTFVDHPIQSFRLSSQTHPMPRSPRVEMVVCGPAMLWNCGEDDAHKIGKVQVAVSHSGKSNSGFSITPLPARNNDPVRVFDASQVEVEPFTSQTIKIKTGAGTHKLVFEMRKAYIRFLCAVERTKSRRNVKLMDLVLQRKLKNRKMCLNALYKYVPPFELNVASATRTNKALSDVLFGAERVTEAEPLLWSSSCPKLSVATYVLSLACREHHGLEGEFVLRFTRRREITSIFHMLSNEDNEEKVKGNRELRDVVREYVRLLFCSALDEVIAPFYEINNILKLSIAFENTPAYTSAQLKLPMSSEDNEEQSELHTMTRAVRIALDFPMLIPLDSGDTEMNFKCGVYLSVLIKNYLSVLKPFLPDIVAFVEDVSGDSETHKRRLQLIQIFDELTGILTNPNVTLSNLTRSLAIRMLCPTIVLDTIKSVLGGEEQVTVEVMALIEKTLFELLAQRLVEVPEVLEQTTLAFIMSINRRGDGEEWWMLANAFEKDIVDILESWPSLCRSFIDRSGMELAVLARSMRDEEGKAPLSSIILSVLCAAASHDGGWMVDTLGDAIQSVLHLMGCLIPYDVAPFALQFWTILASGPRVPEQLLLFTGNAIETAYRLEVGGGAYAQKVRRWFGSVRNGSICVTIPPLQEENARWLVQKSPFYKALDPANHLYQRRQKRLRHCSVSSKRTE